MAANRRTQPLRATGTRAPSAALSAALAGSPALKPNPMDQTRKLAKTSGPGKLSSTLSAPAAPLTGPEKSSLAGLINDAAGVAPNRSSSKTGTTAPKPKPRTETYSNGGVAQTNHTGNVRDGEDFRTYVDPARPGYMIHEYQTKSGPVRIAVKAKATGAMP